MSDQDYAAIRRNVEQGLSRQKQLYRLIFFGVHLLFFALSMLAVWGTVAAIPQLRTLLFYSEPGAAAVVVVPTILWSLVLLFHVASLYFESSVGEQAIRERLLMREIGEDMLRQARRDQEMAEKPKRGAAREETAHVIMHDDGELLPINLDELLDEHGDSARAYHSGES